MTETSPANNREPALNPSRQQSRSSHARHEPPRQQAETRTLSEKFSAKIEGRSEDSGRGSEKEADGLSRHASSRSNAGSFDSLSGESGQQSESEFARSEMARIVKSGEAVAAANQATASRADNAVIEKMAAHIAESWPGAGQKAADIDFPPGSLAQGAHLLRQSDGSIAIRIAGLDPKLNALRAGYAQLALMHGLDRRRLRVASLVFERSENSQRGRLSEIPKTV